ncbi:MAG: hypothetical protein R2794_01040 [Chitinophagales bacterium]
MKKTLYICCMLASMTFLFSCTHKEEKLPSTPLEKAQYAVQHYLSDGEHAVPKYTSVSFGNLDSTFSTMPTDSTTIWLDSAQIYGDMAMEYLAKDLKKTICMRIVQPII